MKKQTVHLQDTLDTSSTTCLVHTVDTDMVIIIIGKFHVLTAKHPAADIWTAFGAGKNFMYIATHQYNLQCPGKRLVNGASPFSLLYWL